MIATAPPLTSSMMAATLDINRETGSNVRNGSALPQRQFKKHKSLPKPQRATSNGHDASPSSRLRSELAFDDSTTTSQTSSPRSVKQQSRRRSNGPELPPTPPTHSRTSSSTHSAIPSSPTITDNLVRTPVIAPAIPPRTPPDQLSPPTPDVTPPQPASRPRALHPNMADYGASRNTTVESRTDSFRTAREEPLSSEDDDGKSTIRPSASSGRTSQSTVRKISNSSQSRLPNPQALDLALSRLTDPPESSYTPKTQSELAQFDGDWASPSELQQRTWDEEPSRSLTVKKRQTTAHRGERPDVVDDHGQSISSNNATRAVRQMSLNEKASPKSSNVSHIDRATRSSSGPSNSSSSVATSQRQSSGVSSRSTTSTIIEAFLVDTPQGPPSRQRTLRHVRKHDTLRGPPASPAIEQGATPPERGRRPSRPPIANQRPDRTRHDSYASTSTVSSVSSGKARREVWKSGGIPVVVVPDRQSSRSQSREPSLRSTSSRRSKRTHSLSSAQNDTPPARESGPVFERPFPRPRAYSLSESSDVRTIDYPPAIPARSSSLSAPTSRNTSRAGSMTADSVRAREAIQTQPLKLETAAPSATNDNDGTKVLGSPLQFASPKFGSDSDAHQDSDRQEDALSTRKFPARTTPFSIISMETNGTVPEVSEAQAVQMYAHQNSSLVMVNHSSKPSDASDATRKASVTRPSDEQPRITMTAPDGNEASQVPMTPPQPQFTLEDVDSPLRHPRPPPEPPAEPPAITFTSATPSGATPGPDKALQIGNYFETMAEVPTPPRRASIVERAFSRRRRNSVSYPPNASKSSGLLKRAFSLSRRRSSSSSHVLSPNQDYPQEGVTPPEEHKLHPFWKPVWSEDEYDDEDDDEDDDDYHRREYSRSSRTDEEQEDGYFRYPLYDNRPGKPKRRFSEKMRRTFAVLPIGDEEDYSVDEGTGPQRRTIRRTSSGNLKVMRRRNSASSLRRRFSQSDRPYTAPDEERGSRSFWRGSSVHKRLRSESRRRFSLGDQIEEIQNLPRRLSDRRREKRSSELRQKISGPRDVRDGVEEMLRSGGQRYDDDSNIIHGRF